VLASGLALGTLVTDETTEPTNVTVRSLGGQAVKAMPGTLFDGAVISESAVGIFGLTRHGLVRLIDEQSLAGRPIGYLE
jgi:hypothetical protein